MIFEILLGIKESKYTNIKQVMSDFGFSDYLLRSIFTGMEKRGLLVNINYENYQVANAYTEEKYCKGFHSYWLLTEKGKYYINKNNTRH